MVSLVQNLHCLLSIIFVRLFKIKILLKTLICKKLLFANVNFKVTIFAIMKVLPARGKSLDVIHLSSDAAASYIQALSAVQDGG